MNLNLNLNNVDLSNHDEIIKEIDQFKVAVYEKCEDLKKEIGDSILESLKTDSIRNIEYCDLYSVDRESLQNLFCNGIKEMGFDYDGYYDRKGNDEEYLKTGWFENEVFMLRPFSWSDSDCTCGLNVIEDEHYFSNGSHKELGLHAIDCYNCSDRVVNFWYKPTNLKIYWYKYPFRSAYSNQIIDEKYLKSILDDSKNSLKR